MKCRSCGTSFENRSHYCPNCGKKQKAFNIIPLFVLVALLCTSAFGFVLFHYFNPYEFSKTPKTTAVVDSSSVIDEKKPAKKEQENVEVTKTKAKPASEISKNVQKDVSQLIDESLKKVVTIYTDTSQGSGFLINDKGDVLTNAHVVEGFTKVTALDSTDQQYSGSVIGYSNNTDVAIVRVAGLAGKTPLSLETSSEASIGEEVIALGSPSGLRNTASLGYITGVNRSFIIGERSYENIYQMSAHIAEGSSGGPLLSLKTGKAMAINSARLIEEDSVGFSIPIKDIYSLISEWIASPLSEKELYSLFYTDNGTMYYQEETQNGEDVYFDGGDYSDDHSSYYEIPNDWYSTDESKNEDNNIEERLDGNYSGDEYQDPNAEDDGPDPYLEENQTDLVDGNGQDIVDKEINKDNEVNSGADANY